MADVPFKLKLSAFNRLSSGVDSARVSVNKFSLAVFKAKTKAKNFSDSTKKLRTSMTNIGNGAVGLGKKFSAGITAPVIAAGVGAVKSFADFEQGLTGVKTLLDESSFGAEGLEQGFAKMKAGALALGKTVPVNLGQMNSALFDAVSAGVEAGKAVDFVGVSSKLAVAGLTDVKTATDGMTSAMNAFGMKAGDADKIAAKFFSAQKAGKTTIAELSQNFGKVASTAAATGVSFEEVLAGVSAATLGGVKTAEAFTSLKAVLSNIQKPSETAKEAAKVLGIQFDSTSLRAQGFGKFMQKILKASAKQGLDTNLVFEKLFGSTEALNFASAVAGSQYKKFNEIVNNLKDDTASLNTFQSAFATQSSTLTNRLSVLKNTILVNSITLGEKLLPVVNKMITKFTQLFDFFQANPELAKLATQAAVLGAALGPLLIVGGSLFKAFSAGILIFGKLKAVLAVLAAPIILKIGLIAALATGAFMLIKNFGKVKQFFINLWNEPRKTMSEFVDFFKSKFSFITSTFSKGAKLFSGVKNIFFGDGGGTDESAADRRTIRSVPQFGSERSLPGPATRKEVKKNSKVEVSFRNLPAGSEIRQIEGDDDELVIDSGLQTAFG